MIVESSPAGVPVFVDGVPGGVTPATLSVKAGAHIVELRGRGAPRVFPVKIAAGGQVSQYVELATVSAAAPALASVGQLDVRSDPPGARVLLDGEFRGVSPVVVRDLAPGQHLVVLQTDGGVSAQHTVVVEPGVIASLVVPLAGPSAGPVSGWVSIVAPFIVNIFEGGKLLGTSETERILITTGRHELEIVNETLGFRVTKVLQVPPGKVARLTIELPLGVMHINASPWAEVWIDGQRVGETPIGNLPVAIGPHEVIFRHPELGEIRQAVSVTLSAPARLSVTMQQKD
ncbi:MAG: PEGA domain-containing protein [Acidobacteria bacterium]|nr:PEGA domain-containing protein [Acidobacteriota bacterium]